MTAPRQILPGTTYLVTRRCAQREFLLRPSETTNSIFLYVLATAARRYAIQVHAYCVLSNHFHLVVTDPAARLPAFEQYLDSLVARAVNATLGRWEAFWAPSSYSAVALQGPDEIVEKITYVLANPVSARLVNRAADWPGLWSAPDRFGGPAITAHRPESFFSSNGTMPPSVDLPLALPPGFQHAHELRERVAGALRDAERRARGDDGARRALGPAHVMTQQTTARAHSPEPRRRLNPRVACRDKWKRIEVLQRLRTFLQSYRAAWLARRGGDLAAVFPAGTYLMRVAHCAPCAPA